MVFNPKYLSINKDAKLGLVAVEVQTKNEKTPSTLYLKFVVDFKKGGVIIVEMDIAPGV